MPGEEDQIDTEELVLEDEVVGFEDEQEEDGDGGETDIHFSDEEQGEEPELVKKLRSELRERDRKLAQYRRAPAVVDDDPEPVVPEEPSEDDAGWDFDKFREAMRAREKAVLAHADWKARQAVRDNARTAAANEQAKRVEQQKNALGIKDYDTRSQTVREILSEPHLAVLINGAKDPARLIAALGAPAAGANLSLLAAEENLARFAFLAGDMERKIKVTKKSAPAPESQVRGATASLISGGVDKHLERLEKEADRTGDRSKVIQYRREQREKKRAA